MFTFPIRVYYEDTDAGGVVYYANYLKFFERARTELLRSLGVERSLLAANGDLGFVVRRISVDYDLPARLDDLLEVQTQVLQLRKASLQLNQTINCNGKRLCSAQVTLACVQLTALRAVALPKPVVQALAKLLPESSTVTSFSPQ